MQMTERLEPALRDGTAGRKWRLGRDRGLLTAAGVLVVLASIILSVSATPLSYYDISQIVSSGTPLAIAGMGQTLVILSGGFDLSAAAVISLVNVSLAALPPDAVTSPVLLLLIGIGIGALVGMVNGALIAFLRLQPIVVTLATMFILQGATLLVMDKPGGVIDASLGEFMGSEVIPGFLPMTGALILACLALWYWLKATPFGIALYAVGGDADSARSAGIATRRARFLTYVLAGGFYGLAGVCVSGQTGAGDPLVGNPMLLQMFAAVVVGGTLLGGGRGGLTGTVIGAFVLVLMVNILLILNVSAYYSTIAESTILLLAVLMGALHRRSELAENLRRAGTRFSAWREGVLARQRTTDVKRLALPRRADGVPADGVRVFGEGQGASLIQRLGRSRPAILLALPAFISFAVVLLATEFMLGNTLLNGNYYNTLLVLSCFLAILALGQGAVILTGGLDLSLPWTIALAGILVSGMAAGSNVELIYAVPFVLLVGALIGLINGTGIVLLGLSPIVMTLATNGFLQGTALIYSGGTPDGFAAPLLRSFMTQRVFGVTPVVIFLGLFVLAAVVLLGRTAFGRRVYAIGNSARAAALSGVPVKRTVVMVYMLSGLCAALVGILLSGLSGQASLGMGDEYLLPSIAAVVVGGTLITGGRGNYAGMLGGVLLLTALQTLLAGTTFPTSVRSIVYGVVILTAVIALRERR
ncbi:ABC transporter permease [Ancylobacter amanitiformis]|uniref:Ribose transport system permease protein n=1 Tax=Ancylobacter amanitiformis TaxID=217069 RepID=A0ABU0LKY0_9HYPH|nr:ABC transporter permease [Ancylobacter amanitiformis]MDQ0509349.1 ribose transport system permease protein [Ancylobacter amanitiformis]